MRIGKSARRRGDYAVFGLLVEEIMSCRLPRTARDACPAIFRLRRKGEEDTETFATIFETAIVMDEPYAYDQ